MNKRALSNLVAYVMLIVIAIALSVLVYGWLKSVSGVVEGGDVAVCSDNVNVVIRDYEAYHGVGGYLTVTVENKGLFSVDGYVLRVHNRTDAEFGFYVFNDTGSVLGPGDVVSSRYNFSDFAGINDITFIDVQPFVLDGENVSCESYASQVVVSLDVAGAPAPGGVPGVPVPAACNNDGFCNVDEDCIGCSADCGVCLFLYDGESIPENLYEYHMSSNGPILWNGTYTNPSYEQYTKCEGSACTIKYNYSNLSITTPELPISGLYNVSFVFRNGDASPIHICDFSISCGGGTTIFYDINIATDQIATVLCDFEAGRENILIETLPDSNWYNRFYYMRIEGPL